ncbi:MAG: dihydrofolate reductase, partial [Bacteroidota bacterium]
QALEYAQQLGKKIFIAGGAQVYTLAEPLADEMYLSIIHGSFTGDAYFPEFDEASWDLAEMREESEFTFKRYRRP